MDVDALQRGLEKYLMQTISFYDAANESYYHGMIVGLCAMMINSFASHPIANPEMGDMMFRCSR